LANTWRNYKTVLPMLWQHAPVQSANMLPERLSRWGSRSLNLKKPPIPFSIFSTSQPCLWQRMKHQKAPILRPGH